ncbi:MULTISPECIES: serine protease [Kosakonia]|jgi:hypothetical protein
MQLFVPKTEGGANMPTDFTLIYPHAPVSAFFPDWIEQNRTSKLALEWQSALVSFFVIKEFNSQEAFLIGSGFLMLCDGKMTVIATASHVITEMRKYASSFISVDGVKFLFEKLEIFFNDKQDYALIPLTKKMATSIPNSIVFSSKTNGNEIKTSSFVIIGYPARHNKLHKQRPEKGLHYYNLTFHNFFYETKTEDVFFYFVPEGKNKNITFENISTKTSVPSLSGMSGGAIAQIIIDLTSRQPLLRAVGIFKEHRPKRGNYLVGATFVDFADEVNALVE